MTKKDLARKKRYRNKFVSVTFFVRATDILERRNSLWEDFLTLLTEECRFAPERYDPDTEPPRYIFQTRDVSKPLMLLMKDGENLLFERYSPYYMFYTIDSGSVYAASPVNFEGLSLEVDYFKSSENIEDLLVFLDKLARLFRPIYGCVAHDDDWNSQNTIYTYFPADHPNAGQVASEKGFGGDTRQGIPGVYWANLFSKIYINTIGEDKFLTTPCYRRQRLSDGGFLLLTSESPLEWDKPQVRELRKAMRNYLGYDYFCDIDNPDRVCKVPKSDFSRWEIDCERGMKIPFFWRE